PNQFRLLLSSVAYVLMDAIRFYLLKGTQLANARCDTIRLKLLKIGAVLIRNTRRVQFMWSSAYPYQSLFNRI
ncbi:MAG: IS1380 family transposase, partial [Phycisphaerae bacterium]|nr:IS1380 family transposase [Phycisphaerae bacterium]NIS53589.1 IS1380 family transposase [Phycisphaerae bacterium]NIX01150.1 IS1380 family transposase [Phycisphaerae bacterium]NIX30805.1 IS1380 family transposase [Phycisphaerae bacterium]